MFKTNIIEFLGFIIGPKGIKIDPSYMAAIKK
jgi:hypothetical protein